MLEPIALDQKRFGIGAGRLGIRICGIWDYELAPFALLAHAIHNQVRSDTHQITIDIRYGPASQHRRGAKPCFLSNILGRNIVSQPAPHPTAQPLLMLTGIE